MFKLLKKKSYMWIGGFLLISMAITFFVVYQTYSSMLTKDFIKKQKFLATQTMQTLSEYLLSIDEQTELIINKNHLETNLKSNNQLFLSRIHFDNNDFSQIEIYSTKKLLTSLSIDNLPQLDITPKELKRILGDRQSCWYLITNKDKNPYQKLLCIKKISGETNTSGYLVACLNSDTLEKILSIYNNSYLTRENKIFASYSNAGIVISNQMYILGDESKNISASSLSGINTEKLTGNSYLFTCKLNNDDMHLILEEDVSDFRDYLSVIKRVLFVIYISISILIIIFLRYFTLKIDETINSLYTKMMLDTKEKSE